MQSPNERTKYLQTEDMIKDIKDAFKQILPNLSWMDEETRNKAIEKVSH